MINNIKNKNEFSSLGLDNFLLKNINYLSYITPTPVQKFSIPLILKNNSLIAISKTGTGKTASFCLPLLQILSQNPFSLFSIILEPTRELAIQTLEKLKIYSTGFNLRVNLIIGGMDYTEQINELEKIPHIIIATPGRLKTLLENNSIKLVENLKFLVLDEFDQLLNDSIKGDIMEIINYLPENRKTLFFSATMLQGIDQNLDLLEKIRGKEDKNDIFIFDFNKDNYSENNINNEKKEDIKNINNKTDLDILISQISPNLSQYIILLNQKLKCNYLIYLLRSQKYLSSSIIIFTNTYKTCNFLYTLCSLFSLKVSQLHSKISQKNRSINLNKFKSSLNKILITTDIASRGLDIPICNLVINYDLPRNPDDYIHRVGRTARMGKNGKCINFVAQYDIDLILAIEKRINKEMEEMNVNEEEIMEDISLMNEGIKLAQIKIYESGINDKERKKNVKRDLIRPEDRGIRKKHKNKN
jgi:ATP-dependent RNA helicase DDX49/DBP8